MKREKGIYSECEACGAYRVRNVPIKFRTCTFAEYKPRNENQRKALEAVRAWSAAPTGFLTLHGDVGLGKTHLSVAALARHAYNGRVIGFNDMIRAVRDSYSGGGDGGVVSDAKSAGVLLIDDVREVGGRDVGNLIFEIVDHRYKNEKPTIITSNKGPGDLSEFFGEPASDRISEDVTSVVLEGESYRRKGGNKSEYREPENTPLPAKPSQHGRGDANDVAVARGEYEDD